MTTSRRFFDPGLIHRIPDAVSACLLAAAHIFDELERASADGDGITRAAFGPGEQVACDPLALDSTLRLDLTNACDALGHAVFQMATAGHDAAMFTSAGIPSGMILVRNAYGSHNADESMDWDDFAEGCRILVAVLAKRGGQR